MDMVVKGRGDGIIREVAQVTKRIEKLMEKGSLVLNAIDHLEGPAGEKKTVSVEDLRGLILGNYMNPDANPKIYSEVTSLEKLSSRMKEYLTEFNAMSRRPMDLVMFLYAVEHVSRIARILNMSGGNALLVGVGGSDHQSLTRLAAFINDCEVIQIEIAKNYGKMNGGMT